MALLQVADLISQEAFSITFELKVDDHSNGFPVLLRDELVITAELTCFVSKPGQGRSTLRLVTAEAIRRSEFSLPSEASKQAIFYVPEVRLFCHQIGELIFSLISCTEAWTTATILSSHACE